MAYSFDQIFAADPANPSNIAQNASVTIFEPGDTSMTPLAITDPDGQPLTNPIPVNANGFGSAFAHATLDRVAWAGGGFTGFFTSYEGMKEVAVAAQAAAETAASTAGADAAAAAQADIEARIAAGELTGPAGADGVNGTNGVNGSNVLPTQEAIEQAIINDGPSKTALNAAYAGKGGPNTYTGRQSFTDGIVLGSPTVTAAPPGAIRALVPQSYTDNPGDNIAFNFQSVIFGDWTPDTGIDPGFVWGTNFYTVTGTSEGSANGVAYMYGGLIEADVRSPAGAHLGIVIGLQAEAAFADAASGALVDDMRSLLVAAPVRKDGATAGTATKAYGMYVQKVSATAVGATEAYSIYVQGGLTRLTGRTEINSEAASEVGLVIKQFPSASADALKITDTFGNINAHVDQFGQIGSANNHIAYEGQAGQTLIGRAGPSAGAAKEAGILFGTAGDARIYRSAANTIALGSGNKLDGVPGVALASQAYNPGSLATLTTTSTTFVDVDATNAAVTFTVPLSGKVTVRTSALIRNQTAGQTVKLNLRNGGVDVAGTGQSMTQESVPGRRQYVADVTGLTPGASVTLTLGWRVVGGTGEITAGSTDVGPLRIDVTAA